MINSLSELAKQKKEKEKKRKPLTEEEEATKITQLIGLGEAARRIYECLDNNQKINGKLKEAYELHQKEIQLQIEYRREQFYE